MKQSRCTKCGKGILTESSKLGEILCGHCEDLELDDLAVYLESNPIMGSDGNPEELGLYREKRREEDDMFYWELGGEA